MTTITINSVGLRSPSIMVPLLDLDVNEFNAYATTQFQKRIERIQKSRHQSLDEVLAYLVKAL